MRSIRTRLTLAYAGAMIGTMLALATALYSVRRVSVMRELEARLNAQADFAVQLVDLARDISPSQLSVTPDSVVTSGILPRMKPLMDLLPSAEHLRRSYYALYEWIGLAWYALR